MAKFNTRGPWYWSSFDPKTGRAGADMAKLRKGLGRDAGDVPEMWPYYKVVIPDQAAAAGTRRTPELDAEHAALTLFAVHQQSQGTTMHSAEEHIGDALLKLRSSKQFAANPQALDERVNAAATASSVTELVHHLKGLVTLLRGQQLPFDYTQLVDDIADWRWPSSRARIRRQWGAHYFAWNRAADDEGPEPQADSR
jgi:CRISPR system Cascade subunit CasB